MQDIRVNRRLQVWAGYALFALGLLGDSAIGELLLTGAGPYPLLLHIPAVLIWALGVNLINNQDSQQELTWRTSRFRVKGLSVAALLLGLSTFPGFGPLVYSIALVIVGFLHQRTPVETPDVTVPAQVMPPTLDLEIQPLIDVLQGSNLEARCAAVVVLSQMACSEANRLLRQLLSDPQAEVRSDASVALTRLADELSHELHTSFEQWMADPEDRQRTLNLADQYYHYACGNVLDEMSQHFYLMKARDLLQQVLTQDGTKAELWMKLARIHQNLGEVTEALHAVRAALQLQPDALEAYLLAMELAFGSHSWDILISLAREALSRLPDISEAQASLQWWAALHPDLPGGTSHG